MLNNSVKMNNINAGNVTIKTILIANICAMKKSLVFLSTIHNKNLTNPVKNFNIIVIFENLIYKIYFHL